MRPLAQVETDEGCLEEVCVMLVIARLRGVRSSISRPTEETN